LLDGPSVSGKKLFLDVIRGIDKPEWNERELPVLKYVFKPQILSSKDQFSSINNILEQSADMYIFDEPTGFLRDEESSSIATLISDFITKNKKIGIISSENKYMKKLQQIY